MSVSFSTAQLSHQKPSHDFLVHKQLHCSRTHRVASRTCQQLQQILNGRGHFLTKYTMSEYTSLLYYFFPTHTWVNSEKKQCMPFFSKRPTLPLTWYLSSDLSRHLIFLFSSLSFILNSFALVLALYYLSLLRFHSKRFLHTSDTQNLSPALIKFVLTWLVSVVR